ncbi:MAG: SAM-dependent methyltransferase [Prevotella sp.]|nr:SAM-dependent methyltransferase [Prevotella sp.]
MTTEQFIQEHLHDDVRYLALQRAKYPDVDLPFALDQIRGWQTARQKLPTWAAIKGVIYPPHLSMEQCSSEATAVYKASIAKRLSRPLGNEAPHGALVDLTGGFGVDFAFMKKALQGVVSQFVYVERQETLCSIAKQNFQRLGLDNAEVLCADGVEYLHAMPPASLVFIDPARRDTHGARTFAIADCTPDVLSIERELLQKADHAILKLSPMLDISATVEALGREKVREVHVVSVANECKELLVVLSERGINTHYYCVNDGNVLTFASSMPLRERGFVDEAPPALGVGGHLYLYEPNASIMKMGCFGILCQHYGVKALGANSHLFVSQDNMEDFPGRSFQVRAITSMNKKELRRHLQGITRANITTRNFPLSASDLRKRLALRDGGDTYIFATTNHRGEHILLICGK